MERTMLEESQHVNAHTIAGPGDEPTLEDWLRYIEHDVLRAEHLLILCRHREVIAAAHTAERRWMALEPILSAYAPHSDLVNRAAAVMASARNALRIRKSLRPRNGDGRTVSHPRATRSAVAHAPSCTR